MYFVKDIFRNERGVSEMETFDKQKYIFACFFLFANKFQILGDAHLADEGITIKQWYLMIVISQYKDKPPMLTEVAQLMGTSRQNAKQLALKLQEKGFLIITRDQEDSRILRLKLTEKNKSFWEGREEKDRDFIMDLFKNLDKSEVDVIYNSFNKLLEDLVV